MSVSSFGMLFVEHQS